MDHREHGVPFSIFYFLFSIFYELIVLFSVNPLTVLTVSSILFNVLTVYFLYLMYFQTVSLLYHYLQPTYIQSARGAYTFVGRRYVLRCYSIKLSSAVLMIHRVMDHSRTWGAMIPTLTIRVYYTI